MPAGLPGDSAANNLANPSVGRPVIFDPLSGPKGSPFDKGSAGTCSTGALSTGIGFGLNSIFYALQKDGITPLSPQVTVAQAGFNYNQEPGTKPTYAAPPPPGVVTTNFTDGRYMYIGGGRTTANVTTPDKYSVPFVANPYVTGIALMAAGNGGSRDAGSTSPYTGFGMRLLGATGAVANGNAVVAGYTNRSGIGLVNGQSVFASETAAQAAPA
jgi:hypothetical protein